MTTLTLQHVKVHIDIDGSVSWLGLFPPQRFSPFWPSTTHRTPTRTPPGYWVHWRCQYHHHASIGTLQRFRNASLGRTVSRFAGSGVSHVPSNSLASTPWTGTADHGSSAIDNKHVTCLPSPTEPCAQAAEDILYRPSERCIDRGSGHVDRPLWTNCLTGPHARDSVWAVLARPNSASHIKRSPQLNIWL